MSLFTYDPAQILVTMGGVPISGFESGTFVTIEKVEDNWSAKSGIEGDAVRILKTDYLYNVTLTLMYTSASNDYLSALATADANLPGSGLVPLEIKNGLGRSLFVTTQSWVVKPASTNYSDAADPREWGLQSYKPLYFAGGQ